MSLHMMKLKNNVSVRGLEHFDNEFDLAGLKSFEGRLRQASEDRLFLLVSMSTSSQKTSMRKSRTCTFLHFPVYCPKSHSVRAGDGKDAPDPTLQCASPAIRHEPSHTSTCWKIQEACGLSAAAPSDDVKSRTEDVTSPVRRQGNPTQKPEQDPEH